MDNKLKIKLFYNIFLQTSNWFHSGIGKIMIDENTFEEYQVGGIAVFDKKLFMEVWFTYNDEQEKWTTTAFHYQAISLS